MTLRTCTLLECLLLSCGLGDLILVESIGSVLLLVRLGLCSWGVVLGCLLLGAKVLTLVERKVVAELVQLVEHRSIVL